MKSVYSKFINEGKRSPFSNIIEDMLSNPCFCRISCGLISRDEIISISEEDNEYLFYLGIGRSNEDGVEIWNRAGGHVIRILHFNINSGHMAIGSRESVKKSFLQVYYITSQCHVVHATVNMVYINFPYR